MLVTEFIRRKKLKSEHSAEEIKEFITRYTSDQIPDYQVSAWLMAVCLNGMSKSEAVALTQAMVDSGQKLEWELSKYLPCDKHSTGGVGDKTSLIIAPLVASFGIPVPMMAGRGLGFTGGTLDKLESIPGFQTRIPVPQLRKQIKELGVFLVGQTDEVAPADKRMYSLRDVTSTVESLPLICASILSKKIAEGAKALVMDVKVGTGAFMNSVAEAKELAQALIDIGKLGGLNVRALITDMNQPLGRFVGNSLEVYECLEILKNNAPKDGFKDYSATKDLSVELSAQMLLLSGYLKDIEACRKACLENLENGSALKLFEKFVHIQGGDLQKFTVKSNHQFKVKSEQDGFLNITSNKHIGLSSLLLGGGRQISSDIVDAQVGTEVLFENGSQVKKNDVIFKLHFNNETKLAKALEQLMHSFQITEHKPQSHPLVHLELT